MSVSYTYGYERLEDPSQQIRLLTLNEALDNGSVLTGRLSVHNVPPRNATRTARLRKHLGLPGYLAISYVWGTGPDLHLSHEIILENRRFPITANLHAALHSYRSQTPTSLRFWVDAICVNQADDHEKSAQIPLMRDVYHLALFVAVWLGDETAETTRVKRFFSNLAKNDLDRKVDELTLKLADIETENRNMGQRKRPLAKVMRTESERLLIKGATKGALGLIRGMQIGLDVAYNSLSDHLDEQKVQEHGVWTSLEEIISWSPNEKQLKLVHDEDFQEMATLLDKTLFSDTQYFNRMWTLQEICVANCGLVLVLGMDLDELLRAFYYIQRKFDISSAPSIEKITTILEINSKFNDGERQSLRALLALSAGRKSENPRDRIYALQGLMKDEMNPLLQPDYAKSVANVYANASRHIIFTEKSLDVICGHQLQDRLPELPSWVPDFRHFALETGALVQHHGKNIIYHASICEQHALPKYPFQLAHEFETITVTGIHLGNVSILSDISVPGQDLQTERFSLSERQWAAKLIDTQEWKPEELKAISIVSDIIARYAEFYQNSNRASFWARNPDKLQRLRAITGNANEQSGSALDLHFKYFLTLLCGRIAPTARCKEEELLEHMTRLCIPDQEGIEALERLCKALDAGTRGRRLIISEGKQMGAAPEETQKGDMIYILMGCSVPTILRRTARPNEFEFVGECYWHGFMDGEALATRDGDKVTAHELKLV